MNKPHRPRPATNQKAPKASRPRAPFERNHENPPPHPARKPATPGESLIPKAQFRGLTRQTEVDPRKLKGPPVGARVNRRAADRLRAGHLWVYASDIESIDVGEGDPPALLPVADSRGLLLGTALYSPSSQIALRMVSREASGRGWMAETAGGAASRSDCPAQTPLAENGESETDACRLCFSEADELPGLVADKYGELVILQLLTKGLDSARGARNVRARSYAKNWSPDIDSGAARPADARVGGPGRARTCTRYGRPIPRCPATSTQFQLNGLLFHFDANAGQKTGAFLDQRANYAAAQEWAQETGLQRAGRWMSAATRAALRCTWPRFASQVTGIDSSRASLEVAERNLEANRARSQRGGGLGGGRCLPDSARLVGRAASDLTPSCSIRRPLPRQSGPSREPCAATRN